MSGGGSCAPIRTGDGRYCNEGKHAFGLWRHRSGRCLGHWCSEHDIRDLTVCGTAGPGSGASANPPFRSAVAGQQPRTALPLRAGPTANSVMLSCAAMGQDHHGRKARVPFTRTIALQSEGTPVAHCIYGAPLSARDGERACMDTHGRSAIPSAGEHGLGGWGPSVSRGPGRPTGLVSRF